LAARCVFARLLPSPPLQLRLTANFDEVSRKLGIPGLFLLIFRFSAQTASLAARCVFARLLPSPSLQLRLAAKPSTHKKLRAVSIMLIIMNDRFTV
jgi:hypothetical protein